MLSRPSKPHVRITLELPSEAYTESFFEGVTEFASEGLPQMPEGLTRKLFPGYVQRLHDYAIGKNLTEGHIPSKEFWMVDADGYAGRIILGLTYTATPERVGHHVGYAVRPSRRRRGYATAALHLLLDEARKLRIYKLMPSCGTANVASRKVIEANGGVLLNEDNDGRELRFLIDLAHQPENATAPGRT